MSFPDRTDAPCRVPMWRRYLRFHRADLDADVADELQFHLEAAAAEYEAAGMTRVAAEAEAHRRFGDVDVIAGALRTLNHAQERRMRWTERLEAMRSDLRFALTQLAKSPGFTAASVLTLALGIGATSAIFSVVYSVLLRPLPYAHADRLMTLRERNGPRDTRGMVVSPGNYAVWLQRARSFEALGAATGGPALTLTGVGDPQSIRTTHVSAQYWKALYLPPVAGRYFRAEEDVPGAAPVAVLSYALWQSSFGGDRSVVGRTVTLSGTAYSVIGVASPDYALAQQPPNVYVPLALSPSDLQEHGDHELSVFGLVRDGIPAQRAVAELGRIEAVLAAEYPNANFDGAIVATSLGESVVGPVRPLLLVLFGAVGLVLLIGCVNVANLLLARAAVRQKEIALRAALGAARGRIVAQLLVESLALSLIGAAAGIAVAAGGVHLLVHVSPPGAVPRLQDARLSGAVLGFTLALALTCGFAFGLYPAVRASRVDLQSVLREGGRDATGGVRSPLRSALVVLQTALALVLLVSAGLLIRSSIAVRAVPPGFDPRNVVISKLSLPETRYSTEASVATAYGRILDAASEVPGVAAAALVSRVPIGASGFDCAIRAEGAEGGPAAAGTDANVRSASPSFFAVLRVPLLRGRSFATADAASAPPVAILNRGLARRLFGDADPIGRRVANCVGGSPAAPLWRTVVGVTGDIHAHGLAEDVADEVYFPHAQFPEREMTLLVRGAGSAVALTPAIRRAVGTVDPLLPLAGTTTMDEVLEASLATSRFVTLLLTLLGGTGLILAVIGLYGVVAYFVAQRTREIGVRMALGATATNVIGSILREGLALTAVGIALGTAVALLATGTLAHLLYGVSTHDPLTFAAVPVLLVIVAMLASIVPARRATRVDPLAALRSA